MAVDKLKLFNGALLICGQRFLTASDEEGEPSRLLNNVYDDGGVEICLGEHGWKFARVDEELSPSPSVTPAWGWKYAFAIPANHVRTIKLCSDPYWRIPCAANVAEVASGYIYSDLNLLYLAYVSKATDRGFDSTRWPPDFLFFAQAYFASRIIIKLSHDKEERKQVADVWKEAQLKAQNSDAIEEGASFPPESNWSRARRGSSSRVDRPRGRLIG